MPQTTTGKRPALAVALALWAAPAAAAHHSLIDVACQLDRKMILGGTLVTFAPRDDLRFEISVANDEGEERLYLSRDFWRALRIEVERDGARLGDDALEFDWSERAERFPTDGEPPAEFALPGLLDPGQGAVADVAVGRRDGQPFEPGAYQVSFRIDPSQVTTARGSPWSGRGGFCHSEFELRRPETLEERKGALLVEGSRRLLAGDPEGAVETFEAMVALDPDDLRSYSWLGSAHYARKDFAAAVHAYERAMPLIASGERGGYLPQVLAYAYVALGELEKAAGAFRRGGVPEAQIPALIATLEARVAKDREAGEPAEPDDGTFDLTLPGTGTRVVELLRDLAWEFDVERAENSVRRTLDWDEEGPAASRVVSFGMKSTDPHRRTDAGAEYLRLRLIVYEFESEAIASRALDAFKGWQQNSFPGIMCKGAVYRAQKGPFVYVFHVGCQFSRANYDRLVTELEEALSEVEAGAGTAIQCLCGGGWRERAID